MRTRMLAVASVLLAACSNSEPQPTLTLSPTGSQTISGPVLITASPVELANEVIWSLAGPGTLSGTTGPSVTYRPPVPADPAAATVTATARGQTATVTFTGQPAQQAKVVIPALTADVNVNYDQFDIPHIFCANVNDCFLVQGYLQAHDRLFQMDLFRRTAEGRLAELVGPLEADQDKQFLTLFATRDGVKLEQKLAAALDQDPATKAGLTSYAAGVNAYLAFLKQNPTQMPREYAQISAAITPNDIPDWTPADTLAVGRLQQFQLSETIEKETGYGQFAVAFGPGGAHVDTGRFGSYVLAVQPVNGFTLSTTDENLPSAPPLGGGPAAAMPDGLGKALGNIDAQMRDLNAPFGSIREGTGSNNWVVDADHSSSNQAMVANDPHLSLQYPPLFHLFAMTASDASGLNITGGSFPGIPGALVGRGTHVGWGVTVVGYDVTDLYMDTLAACGLPVPCVNGVPLLPIPFDIKVRGGTDVTGNVLVVRQHGPIIKQIDATHVISMRWTGHEVTQDVKAFLGLAGSASVGDLTAAAGTAFGALKDFSIGAQNFVLADDGGHIGYDPHALVPRRDWSFAPGTAGTAGHVPWFPLTGDGTAEWGSGVAGDNCAGTGATAPAIPGPCWVPDDKLPRGVNPPKGYFATANSDPAGFTGRPPPGAQPSPFGSSVDPNLYPFLSFDWDDPTDIRYARIAELLKAKTAGGKVSLADMQDIQSDHVLLLAKIFEDRSFYPADTDTTAVTAPNKATYDAARNLLLAWKNNTTAKAYDCPPGLTPSDPKSAAVTDAGILTNSAGCFLFHAFLNKLLHNVFDDDFAFVAAANGQKSFGGDTGAEIRALVVALLPNLTATGTFCDDVKPTLPFAVAAAKSCGRQVGDALVAAFQQIAGANGTDTKNWLWGRVHTLSTVSPASPLIANGFTSGPFARPGGALTVDVGNPGGSQSSPLGFAYGSGSNVRHISGMDPNTPQVKVQLPGPGRDVPCGSFTNTTALLDQYVNNVYFDFLHGHQIDNKGASAQGFSKQ